MNVEERRSHFIDTYMATFFAGYDLKTGGALLYKESIAMAMKTAESAWQRYQTFKQELPYTCQTVHQS